MTIETPRSGDAEPAEEKQVRMPETAAAPNAKSIRIEGPGQTVQYASARGWNIFGNYQFNPIERAAIGVAGESQECKSVARTADDAIPLGFVGGLLSWSIRCHHQTEERAKLPESSKRGPRGRFGLLGL
jgi:hypothetical protein